MALQKNRVVNSNRAWDAGRVYKVNEVVQISGVVYQNLTGGNSDPALLVDWVVVYQDVGVIYTQAEVDALLADKSNDSDLGFAIYTDTVYTVGSPFAVTLGSRVKIPNNNGSGIITQLPLGVTTFYDSVTGKLIATNNGDVLSITLRFKAKMSVLSGYFDLDIDIGGTENIISGESVIFTRGSGIEQRFDIDLDYFTGLTFIANGGDLNVTPINGDMDIYDISFFIKRLSKGRAL